MTVSRSAEHNKVLFISWISWKVLDQPYPGLEALNNYDLMVPVWLLNLLKRRSANKFT